MALAHQSDVDLFGALRAVHFIRQAFLVLRHLLIGSLGTLILLVLGMAAFDFWGRWRALPMRPGLRLGLVFCCALIHGLGLAGGLADLGVNSSNLGWSLAGFNTGIELAQVGVAALFAAAMQGLRLALGPRGPVMAARLASVIGAVVGFCWFAERLVPPPDINSKVVAAADAKAYSKAYCQPAPNLSCAGQTVGWGAIPP